MSEHPGVMLQRLLCEKHELILDNEQLRAENAKLRTALENCHDFFMANNRPSYLKMIDTALTHNAEG